MTNNVKLLVMGMPRVGKTTFLAALWHVLISGEVEDSLALDSLQPSRGHLNSITKIWREWREIPRTSMTKERSITIKLRIPGQPQVFELEVPDASGDAFRRMFETRQCRSEFAELARSAQGILLFLHPRQAVPPQPIDATVTAMADEVPEHDETTTQFEPSDRGETAVHMKAAAGDDSADTSVPLRALDTTSNSVSFKWAPRLSTYQAKLVDLLQIAKNFRDDRPCRISIIVSAWDVCSVENLPPRQWVEDRLPLLYHYLMSNRNLRPFEIYGVSAQGAALDAPGALLDLIHASDRISVVSLSGASKDITLPIRFLLEKSGEVA